LRPGIIINDCGDKMGIQGVDNGMISFRSVAIPRENLLDKVTQVAPDGTVTSIYAKKEKRFAVQLAALSDGRVKIGITCLSQSLAANAIACRFTAVRRQFGAKKYDEQVLLNYPSM
jgi:acyl-CoA oxidase